MVLPARDVGDDRLALPTGRVRVGEVHALQRRAEAEPVGVPGPERVAAGFGQSPDRSRLGHRVAAREPGAANLERLPVDEQPGRVAVGDDAHADVVCAQRRDATRDRDEREVGDRDDEATG